MQIEEMKKLAKLARVHMGEEEMKEITGSFDSILLYISQIEQITSSSFDVPVFDELFPSNVMREDIVTNNPSMFSDKIKKQFSGEENGYLKVKQIL